MKVSTRNQLTGTVVTVTLGNVMVTGVLVGTPD
jgi:molybdopterin-binding protein